MVSASCSLGLERVVVTKVVEIGRLSFSLLKSKLLTPKLKFILLLHHHLVKLFLLEVEQFTLACDLRGDLITLVGKLDLLVRKLLFK